MHCVLPSNRSSGAGDLHLHVLIVKLYPLQRGHVYTHRDVIGSLYHIEKLTTFGKLIRSRRSGPVMFIT